MATRSKSGGEWRPAWATIIYHLRRPIFYDLTATDLDENTFRVNMAWTLRLPFAAFDGLRCRCGRVLSAEGAVAHVLSCGPMLYLHTGIHHTLGRGFDTIGLEAPGAPRIVGLFRGGAPAVGSWVDRNGVSHLVLPDRIITGVAGDGMPVRNILDFVCPNPARRSTAAAGTSKLRYPNTI